MLADIRGDGDLACFRQTQADLAKALIDVTHMRAKGAACVLGEATVCLAVAVSARPINGLVVESANTFYKEYACGNWR